MPLRASKMNGFILGFQRLVWCPKWTPASNSSLMPMLSTVFPLVRSRLLFCRGHPAENGIALDVVVAGRTHSGPAHKRPFGPPPLADNAGFRAEGTGNLPRNRPRARLNLADSPAGISGRLPSHNS